MEFLKCFIDENQEAVVVEYKNVSQDNKVPMIIKSFKLDKLVVKEPLIETFLEGDVTSIYYEWKWDHAIGEKNFGYKVETLDSEIVEWCDRFVRDVCLNDLHEDLLKPPSIDEQVEDFIKEFFEDDAEDSQDYLANFFNEIEENVEEEFNSKKAEQKDFLEEFFAELEDDNSSSTKE